MYLLKRGREIRNCIAMIHLGRETWEMFVVVLGAFIIKVNVLTKKPESRDNIHKAKIYLKMKKKEICSFRWPYQGYATTTPFIQKTEKALL